MEKGKISSFFKRAVKINKHAESGVASATLGVALIGTGLALAATGVLAPAGVIITGFSIAGACHIGAGGIFAARARKKKHNGPKL